MKVEDKICSNCSSDLFRVIFIDNCDLCEHNGWFDIGDNSYKYKACPMSTKRSQVEVEGECFLGKAYGDGCVKFVCNNCKKVTNIPVISG